MGSASFRFVLPEAKAKQRRKFPKPATVMPAAQPPPQRPLMPMNAAPGGCNIFATPTTVASAPTLDSLLPGKNLLPLTLRTLVIEMLGDSASASIESGITVTPQFIAKAVETSHRQIYRAAVLGNLDLILAKEVELGNFIKVGEDQFRIAPYASPFHPQHSLLALNPPLAHPPLAPVPVQQLMMESPPKIMATSGGNVTPNKSLEASILDINTQDTEIISNRAIPKSIEKTSTLDIASDISQKLQSIDASSKIKDTLITNITPNKSMEASILDMDPQNTETTSIGGIDHKNIEKTSTLDINSDISQKLDDIDVSPKINDTFIADVTPKEFMEAPNLDMTPKVTEMTLKSAITPKSIEKSSTLDITSDTSQKLNDIDASPKVKDNLITKKRPKSELIEMGENPKKRAKKGPRPLKKGDANDNPRPNDSTSDEMLLSKQKKVPKAPRKKSDKKTANIETTSNGSLGNATGTTQTPEKFSSANGNSNTQRKVKKRGRPPKDDKAYGNQAADEALSVQEVSSPKKNEVSANAESEKENSILTSNGSPPTKKRRTLVPENDNSVANDSVSFQEKSSNEEMNEPITTNSDKKTSILDTTFVVSPLDKDRKTLSPEKLLPVNVSSNTRKKPKKYNANNASGMVQKALSSSKKKAVSKGVKKIEPSKNKDSPKDTKRKPLSSTKSLPVKVSTYLYLFTYCVIFEVFLTPPTSPTESYLLTLPFIKCPNFMDPSVPSSS